MDTRPWRLAFPPNTVCWEVDTPENVAFKRQLLADRPPACQLWQIGRDLCSAEGGRGRRWGWCGRWRWWW